MPYDKASAQAGVVMLLVVSQWRTREAGASSYRLQITFIIKRLCQFRRS